ncbi:MAG: B12-binding domain-containing radical SAM protein [Anaerolineae bacterium]|nr:B12-binding domain-containing radical SAM protein [Anaerolineae bacterium]
MTKIALVFPRTRYPSGQPPLGILSLAAVLLERMPEVEVEVIDPTFAQHPLDMMRTRIVAGDYDLVGISVMTAMLNDALDVSRAARTAPSRPLVVWGGPHPTVLPEASLAYDDVDLIALGEAEETFYELVAAGGDPEGIDGLWYKREGQIVRNAPRMPIHDLGALPHPARQLVDMERYARAWYSLTAASPELRGTSVIASRGCPYSCTYCQPTLDKLFGPRLRRRPVPHLLDELRELRERYDLDAFMLEDDTFIAHNGWAMAFAEGLRASGLDYQWGCNVRADLVVRSPHLMAEMARSGLVQVNMGIESGTQRILDDVYNKGITVEEVREAVAICKGLGLRVGGYFMLGAPTETLREVLHTIGYAARLPIDEAAFNVTTPLPGTVLWERTRDLVAHNLQDFDYYRRSVYESDEVLPGRVLDLFKKWAYLRFYAFTPRRAWRILIDDVLSVPGLRKLWMRMKRF